MNQAAGCTKRRYIVSREDLPVCCPMEPYRLWDAHPRVYLPIEEEGRAVCPYCEAEYILAPRDLSQGDKTSC